MSSLLDLDNLLSQFAPKTPAKTKPKAAPAAEPVPYTPTYIPTAVVALRQVQRCACGASRELFTGLFSVGRDARMRTERWEPIPTPDAVGDLSLPRQIRTRVDHTAFCLSCLSTTFQESEL